MIDKWIGWTDEQTLTEDDVANKIKMPPMYHVVLLNDDYTPMDFVVDVLELFFNMDNEKATQVMLEIHFKGKAHCGTYSSDVAQAKVQQVITYAKDHEHPLKCTIEQA